MNGLISVRHLILSILSALVLLTNSALASNDRISRSNFEDKELGSAAEAASFLMRSSFGPSNADITYLQGIGFNAWIDEQMGLPVTLHRPQLEAMTEPSLIKRKIVWWNSSLYANDQLRQRVAFALSEILVISDVNGFLEGQPLAVADFYDTLLVHAFGNYRDLIEDVTLSPTMGFYLSMFRSTRDSFLGVEPDENYAREVMQLFSIGLVQLNLNGTVVTDGFGQPIPTYTQDHIVALAEAFTGWNFAGADGGDGDCEPWEWRWPPANWLAPLEPCIITAPNTNQPLDYHVTSAKTIVGNVTLSAGQTAEEDLQQALDVLFNHPNVGPFLSKRLIQRLVTSNPSADYIARIASVFNNNGSAIRGDLGAMIRAILLDEEALDGYLFSMPNFGKIREPLLTMTHIWRAYDATMNPAFITNPGDFWPEVLYFPENYIGQGPMSSPSVFNFFSPDFAQPGPISNAGLVSPEFQIASETFVMQTANFFYHTLVRYPPPSFPWRSQTQIDITLLLTLANTPSLLLDRINDDLMASQMSASMKQIIVDRINAISASRPTQRVTEALFYVVTSMEYNFQQ